MTEEPKRHIDVNLAKTLDHLGLELVRKGRVNELLQSNNELRNRAMRAEASAGPHPHRRWNIKEDGADLLICKGDHGMGEPCVFLRYKSIHWEKKRDP